MCGICKYGALNEKKEHRMEDLKQMFIIIKYQYNHPTLYFGPFNDEKEALNYISKRPMWNLDSVKIVYLNSIT